MLDLILRGGMGRTLKPHPLAQLVPPMTEEEFAELKADVGEHGLQEPITLFEGKILDGLHRERACREAGAEPRYREFEGDEQAAAHYVLAANVLRRHLTAGQKAMVAVRILPYYRAEAQRRLEAGRLKGNQSARRGANAVVGERAHKRAPARPAVEEAGRAVAVSGTAVRQAIQISDLDPPTADLVAAGKVTLREGAFNAPRQQRMVASARSRASAVSARTSAARWRPT